MYNVQIYNCYYLHFVRPKLPLNSEQQQYASILHYSCLATDKVSSNPVNLRTHSLKTISY